MSEVTVGTPTLILLFKPKLCMPAHRRVLLQRVALFGLRRRWFIIGGGAAGYGFATRRPGSKGIVINRVDSHSQPAYPATVAWLGLIVLYGGSMGIGFVFQFFNLIPTLTALENVLLPRLIDPSALLDAAVRRRAGELLASVGLAGKESQWPARLSHGERQRVAVCRALLNRPSLLLADEVNRAPAKVQSALLEAMQEAVEALAEFKLALARTQAQALGATPLSGRSACELAANVYAADRALRFGLPMHERSAGRSQSLVDFDADFDADSALFSLPESFERRPMSFPGAI